MRRATFIFVVVASACLFDENQTRGLPCNADSECGSELACIEHVCGGPVVTADASEGSESGAEDSESGNGDGTPADDDGVPLGCVASDSECVGDDVVRSCIDGKLSTRGCQGICGPYNDSLGCHYFSEQQSVLCACGPEAAACDAAGAWTCVGPKTQARCDGTKLEYADCDEVCVDAGYGGASDCSGSTCLCDDTCTYDEVRCGSSTSLKVCDGVSWTTYTCQEICEYNGYALSLGCMFFPNGWDSGCWCS